jgi:hypothetical protein
MAKSLAVAYLLWLVSGLFGGHHWYLGRSAQALLWLQTLGVVGVGWFRDAFRLPAYVDEANGGRECARPRLGAGWWWWRRLWSCVCLCLCFCVCMCACVSVYLCLCLCLCTYLFLRVSACVCVWVCLFVSMCLSAFEYLCICVPGCRACPSHTPVSFIISCAARCRMCLPVCKGVVFAPLLDTACVVLVRCSSKQRPTARGAIHHLM